MGFIKKDGYNSEMLGINLEQAYAQITHIDIYKDIAHAMISIQQSRADIGLRPPIDTVTINHTIDKTLPIYEQLYTVAKKQKFAKWEDDIVEEIEVPELEEQENLEDAII